MGAKKSFALGGFLKEKPASVAAEEEAVAVPVGNAIVTMSTASPSSSLVEQLKVIVAAISGAAQPPAETFADEPRTAPTTAPHLDTSRKKPGSKGRGRYEKRTIGIAKELDDFVEAARRSHVRPDGTPTTVYSHFIEDLIAAERQRRAVR